MKTLLTALLVLGPISSFATSKCLIAYSNHPELNNKNNLIGSLSLETVPTLSQCAVLASSYTAAGAKVEFSYESDSDEDLGSHHVFSISGSVKSKMPNAK